MGRQSNATMGGALLLAVLGVGVSGVGCTREAAPFYEDPAGGFRVLPFEAHEDGLDASGTVTRHARIAVALPGGGVEHVLWKEEAYADGAPDDWRWTFVDEKTGVSRVYAHSSTWRRTSVSDGIEKHTATEVRGKRARLDNTVHATLAAASDALAATPLCSVTPRAFAFLGKALLHHRLRPRSPINCLENGQMGLRVFESCQRRA